MYMSLQSGRPGQTSAAGDGGARRHALPLLPPEEEVLSTLNRDGSRRWLSPRLSHGQFLTARRITAYALIAIFTLLPHLRINGKPAMLLDVANRQFTFFGATFLSTDTVLLALFMLATFIAVFLFTAVLGRVWCGWACPQTVYMEFLYRPLERLFEGTSGRGGRARGNLAGWRKPVLYLVYLLVSMFLAHTFLAYFVGVDALAQWMRRSPLEHPGSFAVMAVTTGLMMFNFCYFREQTCVLACPYGRFQAALLDRNSLIVSYDARRGEPRGRGRRSSEFGVAHRELQKGPAPSSSALLTPDPQPVLGDCIDCGLCVVTCPTGIDIRAGLQMECVACTQCIDACDYVMDRIGRPRGLIRYTSQARLAGEPGRLMRGRVLVYSAALLVIGGLLGGLLVGRPSADVEVLRGVGLPYHTLPDGRLANALRIKVTNRGDKTAEYAVSIEGVEGAELRVDPDPLRLDPGETQTANALVVRPAPAVKVECGIRVRDGAGFDQAVRYVLLGPAQGASAAGGGP